MTTITNTRFADRIILILLFTLAIVSAQEPLQPVKPIRTIVIIGNQHTREHVIRRELLVKEGTVPTARQLSESQQRLQNLYLFNRVEFTLVPVDDQYDALIIDVTERLYFYPAPIFSVNERDWSKISYGLSLVHANFRGQNEKLVASFWLGFRPGYALTYLNPWVADSLHLTIGLNTAKYNFNHRTLNFTENHFVNQFTIGKWWSLYFATDLTFKFDRIEVDPVYSRLMHSGDNNENQLGIQLGIRHDRRDLYYYPSRGWFNLFYFYENGLFQDYDHYEQVTADNRFYQSLGPLILALRFYQVYLFGEVPVYRLNYIGFDERIRGHFYTEKEGRNMQVGSMEIRFPLLPIVYYSYDLPPIPPVYLKNLKFGISGCLFIDSGIIWNRTYQYSLDNFDTGFGLGLHFHLPYVEVVRFDYGLNRELRGQFIFETGIAF